MIYGTPGGMSVVFGGWVAYSVLAMVERLLITAWEKGRTVSRRPDRSCRRMRSSMPVCIALVPGASAVPALR